MSAGQLLADIWIPKSAVSTDIKEDEFACPKDILCVDEECEAQQDNQEVAVRNAFCKTVRSTPKIIHGLPLTVVHR